MSWHEPVTWAEVYEPLWKIRDRDRDEAIALLDQRNREFEEWINNQVNQSSGGSGSCLTATTPERAFDIDALFGNLAETGRWRVRTAMNLVRLEISVFTPPSGDDVVLDLISEAEGMAIASCTLGDGADAYASWTGEEAVPEGDNVYFEVPSSVEVSDMVCQAWFDGPGGGGLIFWPVPGA